MNDKQPSAKNLVFRQRPAEAKVSWRTYSVKPAQTLHLISCIHRQIKAAWSICFVWQRTFGAVLGFVLATRFALLC